MKQTIRIFFKRREAGPCSHKLKVNLTIELEFIQSA